jgi:ABC-type nitrate/sulfonate/bicarbonate transport system substrate-binding protein
MVQLVQIVQAVRKVQTRLGYIVLSAVILVFSTPGAGQSQVISDKVVVSYPSKSITNFPILETAKQRGFFQKEALNVSAVYMRGGIDIKALLTGDADFGTGSTTAVTAFVAGAPLRVIMSLNAYVDQGLYAQPKYRSLAQLKGQSIGSLNPGGLVDTLLRRILIQGGVQPEKDVVILNMGGTPERYAALKSGSIAASMLSPPHSLRAEKEGFTKLAATRDYVNVSGTGLVVRYARPAMRSWPWKTTWRLIGVPWINVSPMWQGPISTLAYSPFATVTYRQLTTAILMASPLLSWNSGTLRNWASPALPSR